MISYKGKLPSQDMPLW